MVAARLLFYSLALRGDLSVIMLHHSILFSSLFFLVIYFISYSIGIPQIVLPLAFDQFNWEELLRWKGLISDLSLNKQNAVDEDHMERILLGCKSDHIHQQCKIVAQEMGKEDGLKSFLNHASLLIFDHRKCKKKFDHPAVEPDCVNILKKRKVNPTPDIGQTDSISLNHLESTIEPLFPKTMIELDHDVQRAYAQISSDNLHWIDFGFAVYSSSLVETNYIFS